MFKEFGDNMLLLAESGENLEHDWNLFVEASLKKIWKLYGHPLTPLVEKEIKKKANEVATEIIESIKSEGIPKGINRLLAARKKSDVLKIAKEIIISKEDFSKLVLSCETLNFKHSRKHFEFIPDELKPTNKERAQFFKAGKSPLTSKDAQKFVTKISEIFKQRKYQSVHLFERNNEWHIFYFDIQDALTPLGENHYVHGPHIHYISYLWSTNCDKNFIMQALENRQVKVNSVHIKFQDE